MQEKHFARWAAVVRTDSGLGWFLAIVLLAAIREKLK